MKDFIKEGHKFSEPDVSDEDEAALEKAWEGLVDKSQQPLSTERTTDISPKNNLPKTPKSVE